MHLPFYICAAFGLIFLVGGAVAAFHNARVIRAVNTPSVWKRWYGYAYLASIVCGGSAFFQRFPFGGGTMLGFPFFAAWFSASGADYIGIITVPALIADAVVWFLVPQLILAVVFRRRLPLVSLDSTTESK